MTNEELEELRARSRAYKSAETQVGDLMTKAVQEIDFLRKAVKEVVGAALIEHGHPKFGHTKCLVCGAVWLHADGPEMQHNKTYRLDDEQQLVTVPCPIGTIVFFTTKQKE